jgi:DNA-binding XRE family transcriptional regulator
MTAYRTTSQLDTALLRVLRACTRQEAERIADAAGTKRHYLYAIAGCHRTPNVQLASAICAAVDTLHEQTEGRVPKITVDDIAKMCAV